METTEEKEKTLNMTSVGDIFTSLMKAGSTETRFRLNLSAEDAFEILMRWCRRYVEMRARTFDPTPAFTGHLREVAEWLTGDSPTFGLYLCGEAGNGKTTVLSALTQLGGFTRPLRGWGDSRLVNAKDLVAYARIYSENGPGGTMYEECLGSGILAVDDVGTEPRDAVSYGNIVTAVPDVIRERYDRHLTTFISTNIPPKRIGEIYGERIADRLREMMKVINFGNEPSFRVRPK